MADIEAIRFSPEVWPSSVQLYEQSGFPSLDFNVGLNENGRIKPAQIHVDHMKLKAFNLLLVGVRDPFFHSLTPEYEYHFQYRPEEDYSLQKAMVIDLRSDIGTVSADTISFMIDNGLTTLSSEQHTAAETMLKGLKNTLQRANKV